MNIVAIFSVPRSGSTWLGQIFNSHPRVIYKFQPNFAYSFDYSLEPKSTKEEILKFYEALIKTKDPFVNAEITISSRQGLNFDKKDLSSLVFKETHYINVIENLIKKSNTKVVGLIRSPFSVINSWLKLPKEFKPEWSVQEEWMDAPSKNEKKPYYFFGYNKWKDTTQLFLRLENEYPQQFYIMSYDALVENTESEVRMVFDFCGLSFSEQTLKFINQSVKKDDSDPYSVFKKKLDDRGWERSLPDFIINEIKEDLEFQELNLIFRWI